MIPTLFNDGLTADPGIQSNGVGKLTDCVSCKVDREINGIYELTMQYPRSGAHYADIGLRSLIYIKPDRKSTPQLFRVYRISKPLMGVVTINARHISYDLAGYVAQPFTASTIGAALSGITANTQPTPCPFAFSSSRSTSATFTVTVPCDIWSLMAGQAGSLLDVYTGEYDFDNFGVTLETSIGQDNGVRIEYGKNLVQLLHDENSGEMYTGIYPYYYTEDTGLIELPEKVVNGSGSWTFSKIKAVDLTDRFESAPTQAQLRATAQSYVANNDIGVPKLSLDVDFVPLWQTEEFKGTANDVVDLGDTVSIKYPDLETDVTARIVAFTFNCLKERYDKLTVGSVRTDLGTIIKDTAQNSVQSVQPGTPVATRGAVTNHAVVITPSVTNVTGFIQGGTKTGTPVTVAAADLVSGTKNITQNGTSDVTNYESVSVAVSATLQTKSVTPTETAQTVTPDSGYDGLSQVDVDAVSSTYVGSGITRRTSSDMTFGLYGGSMPYVNAPAGYYEATDNRYMITRGTEGTPTATKGTVSNHSVSVTPSVTNTEGYIAGGTHNGTAVTVSASELVSGNLPITANGNNIDVTNYETVSVNVPGGGGLPLLSTTSLGSLSTSSTSATNTNKTITLNSSDYNDYDVLLVDISVDTPVNGRHTSTVSMIYLTGTSNVNTKNTYAVGSNKWNSKLSSSGVGSTRQSSTAYGIYVNSPTVSGSTMTIPVYYRYNSNNTGTINGTYTARIYGLKLYDLIGG